MYTQGTLPEQPYLSLPGADSDDVVISSLQWASEFGIEKKKSLLMEGGVCQAVFCKKGHNNTYPLNIFVI